LAIGTELDHLLGQIGANTDIGAGLRKGLLQQATGDYRLLVERDVGATRGAHERLSPLASDDGSGNAIRVVEVCIDQVEIEAVAHQLADGWQCAGSQDMGRDILSNFWW